MIRIFFLFTGLIFIGSFSFAQTNDYGNEFNNAKLHLANHKIGKATPILEQLHKQDPSNANLNYLLGLCYVKQGIEIEKAVKFLEKASAEYSKEYNAASNRERKAPEYVYYYLTIAYSLNNQCVKALEALNQFYAIYSYEDEYYLVDGQKWVRECNIRNNEKKEKPQIAEEEEPQVEEAEPKTKEENKEEEIAAESPHKEVKPEEQNKEEKPPTVPKQRFKERLQKYEANKTITTKEIDYTTLNSLYGVQVGAFLEPRFTRDFQGLKNVEVYVDQNGVFRYVIGRFLYHSQAETLLEHVKEAGYKDAFIVDVNDDVKFAEEVVTVGEESIKWQISGKVDFKVQIGAFRKIVPEQIALTYLQVDGIKEIRQKELTILTVGSFVNYESATAYRIELQEMGIEDAFVVAFNYDRKIPVNEAISFLGNTSSSDTPPNNKKKRGKKLSGEKL